MAGSGPNCRLIYICPGRANAWLDIIIYLYLLVFSLLCGFVNNLGLLDLVNGIVYSLAPNSLIFKLADSGPDISLFLLF